jgi:hypothetical protein
METAPLEAAERGRIPILTTVFLTFLIGWGLAYVYSTASSEVNTKYETAVAQARYLARQGIMERGLTYLRSLKPTQLPTNRVNLPSGVIAGVGKYCDVYVVPEPRPANIALSSWLPSFIIHGTGVANFVDDNGESVEVIQTESVREIIISFAHFAYLTDYEITCFGDRISFWTPDSTYGRVHSNDYIYINGCPVFFGLVTTSAPSFILGPAANPVFVNYAPIFNYGRIDFPSQAVEARICASAGGMFFHGEGTYYFRVVFQDGCTYIYRNQIGVPFRDSVIANFAPLLDVAMFFDSPLEIKGTVDGMLTVAASGDVRLIDDVKYFDSGPNGEINPESQNMLGIISESNIIIANTWENGRDNRSRGEDIIINAALLALGGSFTFEDQNDTWDYYNGPIPDERGNIWLWGALAQQRRGYLHRSNHAGTGYGKKLYYDRRFDIIGPPCFEQVVNEMGYSQFEIESWGSE